MESKQQCKFESMSCGCTNTSTGHRDQYIHMSVPTCFFDQKGCTDASEKHRQDYLHSKEPVERKSKVKKEKQEENMLDENGEKQICPYEVKGCTNATSKHREGYIHEKKVHCLFFLRNKCTNETAEHLEQYEH
jgi:hypothetical protein